MTAPTTLAITEAGVYDMPAEEYHRDPVPGGSLSSSGARKLLPPHCPARYRYDTDHPPAPTHDFDLGHAAHSMILGCGPELVVVEASDWRTKAAKEAAAEARERDAVPLLPPEYDQIHDMAAALASHPIAAALFNPDRGKPEQSLFWPERDVWRRARLDWLPDAGPGRLIVGEYKTCRTAEPAELQRTIATYGYHQQGAWYLDAVRALELHDDPQFVFVFQEKTPPYLVTVAQPDVIALRIGALLNRRAIDVYRDCVAAEHWPAYSDEVELVPLPPYVENRYAEDANVYR